MGDHNESERNKNESEDVKECLDRIYDLEMETADLNRRIKALEGVFMRRFAPDTAGHPNDGGWFC